MSQETQCLDILGLQPGSTIQEIRKRYHKLALQYHPDRFNVAPGANERDFTVILHAYESLIKLMSEKQDIKYIEEIKRNYLKKQKQKEREIWIQNQKDKEKTEKIKMAQMELNEEMKMVREDNKFDFKPWRKTMKQQRKTIMDMEWRRKEKQKAKDAFKMYGYK